MATDGDIPDPERTFTDQEIQLLTQNLHSLVSRIRAGNWDNDQISIELVEHFHRSLFHGIRDFAGKIRKRGSGTEYLNFGPNRSIQNTQVEAELSGIFSEYWKSLKSFQGNEHDAAYYESAITLAAWLHAELIRVHPFEDGNGRTSRLVLSLVLKQLGLEPIAITTPKQEYNECLNFYFRNKDIGPLIDLAIRIAADQ